jgi:hypothetical protein
VKDRELLELAAKAAGIDVYWNPRWNAFQREEPLRVSSEDRHVWVPLSDDGDAFRLAMTLGLDLRLSQYLPQAYDIAPGVPLPDVDAFESVRRAIVEASAEIGAQIAP